MVEEVPDLDKTDIHQVLKNERRRKVIECLLENGDPISARELSERIATMETNTDPPPRNIRQSAYVSLHQTHLPKLDELDIIRYDSDSKQVKSRGRVAQVAVHMETVPKNGISWSEYFAGVAIIALLTMVGSQISTPLVSMVSPTTWAVIFFLLLMMSAVFQTYRQRNSF